jgi:hypothetical protein
MTQTYTLSPKEGAIQVKGEKAESWLRPQKGSDQSSSPEMWIHGSWGRGRKFPSRGGWLPEEVTHELGLTSGCIQIQAKCAPDQVKAVNAAHRSHVPKTALPTDWAWLPASATSGHLHFQRLTAWCGFLPGILAQLQTHRKTSMWIVTRMYLKFISLSLHEIRPDKYFPIKHNWLRLNSLLHVSPPSPPPTLLIAVKMDLQWLRPSPTSTWPLEGGSHQILVFLPAPPPHSACHATTAVRLVMH